MSNLSIKLYYNSIRTRSYYIFVFYIYIYVRYKSFVAVNLVNNCAQLEYLICVTQLRRCEKIVPGYYVA